MSQTNDTSMLNAIAGEALGKYVRVKPSVGSSVTAPITVVAAGAGERGIGVTRAAVASGEKIAITLYNKQGTMFMVSAAAITALANVYPAASGQASSTASGIALGQALYAATGAGQVIEVLPAVHLDFSDVASFFVLKDDFMDLLLTGNERLWTGTQTDTGTITLLDSAGGVLQLEASDGTIGDNDESYAGTTNEPFLFAANKPIFFETRVKLGAADTDGANVMVGLVSAANAANTILDNGGGPPASYSGVVVFKVDGGTAWQAEASIAGTQTTITLTSPGAPGTSYQKIGINVIPTSSTSATAYIYIDGVLVGSGAFTYTSATEMSAFVGVKNGGTAVNTTLHVDYVLVAQAR